MKMAPMSRARGRPSCSGCVIMSNHGALALKFWLLVRKVSLWNPPLVCLSLPHHFILVPSFSSFDASFLFHKVFFFFFFWAIIFHQDFLYFSTHQLGGFQGGYQVVVVIIVLLFSTINY